MRAAVEGFGGDGPRARGAGEACPQAAGASFRFRGRRDAVAVGAVFFFLRRSMSGRDKLIVVFISYPALARQLPHAIDATSPPWYRLIDGVYPRPFFPPVPSEISGIFPDPPR